MFYRIDSAPDRIRIAGIVPGRAAARRYARAWAAGIGILCVAPLACADEPSLSTQIVDALNKIYGSHPGFRANHAKGIVVEGSFRATAEAAGLSRAALFNGHDIPVTVRFSDGGGLPTVADGSPRANPHGMAIKYHLPGGEDTDMAVVSLKFFPVGTGEDFRDLLRAISESPPDAPKPTPVEKFFASHPGAPKALATVATPDSFADEEYYGINAFVFISKTGQRQAVRYQLVPDKVVHLDPADAARRAPDFLIDDLAGRIRQKPVIFHLKAQLAAPDDPTKDGSQPWPDDRKIVDLGTLTLDKAVADSLEAQKKLLFMPTSLTDGIELSDDPLPAVRAGAYGVSFARRN